MHFVSEYPDREEMVECTFSPTLSRAPNHNGSTETAASAGSVSDRLYAEAQERKQRLEARAEQLKAEKAAAAAAEAAAVREAQYVAPAASVRESATAERLYRNAAEQRERREKLVQM